MGLITNQGRIKTDRGSIILNFYKKLGKERILQFGKSKGGSMAKSMP